MNATIFLYCDCNFEVALSEGDSYVITQCGNCYHLVSAKKEFSYALTCSACAHEEAIEGDISFEQEKMCTHCGLKGTIGLKGIHPHALFFVENQLHFNEPCTVCKKNEWVIREGFPYPCPTCRKPLNQKVSSVWDEEG